MLTRLVTLGVVLFCFAQTAAFGQMAGARWVGGTGFWINPNNWDCAYPSTSPPTAPCVPNVGVNAIMDQGGNAIVSGVSVSAESLELYAGTVTLAAGASGTSTSGVIVGVLFGAGTLTLTDPGTVWTNESGEVIVSAYSSAGTLNVTNGAVLSTAGDLTVSQTDTDGGTMTISSGGTVTDVNAEIGGIGASGTASLSGAGTKWVNSGSVQLAAVGAPNPDAPTYGIVNLSAGASASSANGLDIGAGVEGFGTMTLTDAGTTWANSGGQVIVGDVGTGTLTIENGAAFSDSGALTVGNFGKGTFNLSGGNRFTSPIATLAVNSGSTGEATVSGMGSWWDVETQLTVGNDGQGSLSVSNKGLVTAAVADVGLFGGSVGKVTVSGSGSSFQVASQLIVGYSGQGSLKVSGGGTVSDAAGYVGYQGGTGTATVSGTGSTWNNGSTLDIGTNGKGTLTVSSGGLVSVGTVTTPGIITIGTQGTVNAKGGMLQGHVINHGVLDPLGTITINGDFTQGVDGTLILDVAGTGAGDFGQLDISGNATVGGTIQFDFIDGFAPSKSDSFDFINVGGIADFSGATIDFGGLLPGFNYADSFQNGQFILTALNDGVASSPTPEPGTLLLFGTALLGLAGFSRFRRRGRALAASS